jgi:hypothetical protein
MYDYNPLFYAFTSYYHGTQNSIDVTFEKYTIRLQANVK